MDLADKIARGLEKQAEKTGKKPLMTTFSVYNLARNNEFDYSKAREELGYTTRSYEETIRDEVQWMKDEGLIEGDPVPTQQSNREIRESGVMPGIIQAMEHEMVVPEVDVVGTCKAIEKGVVDAYQKIEDSVVSTYEKVEDRFVDKFLRKDGETAEEAKARMKENH